MKLALKSTTGAGNGVSYTEAEKKLARQALSAALIIGEIDCPKPLSNSDCTALAAELAPEHSAINTLARAIFRGVIRSTNGSGKKFIGTDEFPKERDPTSVQLLMRGAAKECGLENASIDEAFHRYGGKKAVEA